MFLKIGCGEKYVILGINIGRIVILSGLSILFNVIDFF